MGVTRRIQLLTTDAPQGKGPSWIGGKVVVREIREPPILIVVIRGGNHPRLVRSWVHLERLSTIPIFLPIVGLLFCLGGGRPPWS